MNTDTAIEVGTTVTTPIPTATVELADGTIMLRGTAVIDLVTRPQPTAGAGVDAPEDRREK
jgi:hypothetical protein